MSNAPETQEAERWHQGKINIFDQLMRMECERDEMREELIQVRALALNHEGACVRLKRERDEARQELSSIHRWIERNHADGFIDSLTFLQNLERVVDCWYDRIDEARQAFAIATDQAVQAQCKAREAYAAFQEIWQFADEYLPEIPEELAERWNKFFTMP